MSHPTRAGRYRLEEVIGVGSFATVHRAVDERLDDVVVLKVLAENHSLSPEIRERFIAEGRALRRVASPHVVVVHDLGETDRQQPYLVLEHADRGTLAERVASLRRQGWVAMPDDLLPLARQLAEALEAVHAAGLVHRDLSPSNVLLTTDDPVPDRASRLVAADERLLVADLGLCKDLALNSGLTVAGGTSGFRPPEMQGGPAVIDTRADLWSLSALVRWVCEGASLPPALAAAFDRSLASSPDRRHPDAGAWLAEVEAALAPPELDPEPEPTPTAPSLAAVRRGIRPALAAALAGGALVVGGLTGWVAHESSGPGHTTASASLVVDGPTVAQVGEPVTLRLAHSGVTSWVWILPTGAHVSDAETVTMTPSGEGRAQVEVRGRDADGGDLHVIHGLDVSAASRD